MTLSSNTKEKHIFSTDFRVKRGPHIKLETGKETLNKLTQHKSLTNPEEVHPKKNGKRFEQHRGNIMESYFIYIITLINFQSLYIIFRYIKLYCDVLQVALMQMYL